MSEQKGYTHIPPVSGRVEAIAEHMESLGAYTQAREIRSLGRERDALGTAWRWASYVFDNEMTLRSADQIAYEKLREEVFNAALGKTPHPKGGE